MADHEPLATALICGEVICLFVLDDFFFAPARARELPHRMQFLLESIGSLMADIEALGGRLLLVSGKSIDVVPRLARRWRVARVAAHRWSEPFARGRDSIVASRLTVPFQLSEGETLASPATVRAIDGAPFSAFAPFVRAFRRFVSVPPPLGAPRSINPVPSDVVAEETRLPLLSELGIAHNPRILPGGEREGRRRLTQFLQSNGPRYHKSRDRLDLASTSHLSADLKFGTLSARTVWTTARNALKPLGPDAWASFSNGLLWREFAHSVLWDNPTLLKLPRRAAFRSFPWEENESAWRAWCEGKTGYPVVDAAARQLLSEGFVHERARMISASFLTQDLLIDYRRGEAHYMKYLTDGDWAQNNAGWQWTTGCALDAQPYLRVFNPAEQGRKFDSTGAYVRRWVPELAKLPNRYLHAPAEAPDEVLRANGISLGKSYPRPIVDHVDARRRYLAIVNKLTGQ